jgi:hypothetical protein
MKKLAIILSALGLACGAYAQGTVNMANNATTLVTLSSNSISLGSVPGPAGGYYYGLFVAPSGTLTPGTFSFAGVLGTNQAAAGRFSGGIGRTVAGWSAGQSRAIFVAGWSASWGADWNTVLANLDGNLNATQALTTAGFFGMSVIAPNLGPAGGFDGVNTFPNLNTFGGANGINSGFALNYLPVPEPTTFALAGLGAAAMLIFRRRK